MVNGVKTFLAYSFLSIQNWVVSHTVCADVGGPKKFWDAVGPQFGMGRGLETRVTVPSLVILRQITRAYTEIR